MATNKNPSDSTIYSNIYNVFDNILSPTFHNHGDFPGTSLVSQRLTGCENYHNWSRTGRMTLIVKNKFGFVDGSIQQLPTEYPTHGGWIRCDTVVLTWIMNSISKEITSSIYISILLRLCGII